jgi:hypothetical protein
MSSAGKDIVYIDIDEEITGVVEKVRGSRERIVALVLPKRASVFQSIVNMKLLKRTAEESKKRVVLITSEAAVLPLAGATGLHVAKTLQSKPAIPPAPLIADKSTMSTADPDALDPNAAVGDLAGLPEENDDEIEVDNKTDDTATQGNEPKKKKLKVPNFEKFRLRLFLAIFAVILLIVGWYFAVFVMPKASVVVKTDTSTINITTSFVADPKAEKLDEKKKIVPLVSEEFKKTETEKITPTGEKDLGNKATGTVSVKNCTEETDQPVTIPAGTAASSGGLNFITQESITLPKSSFDAFACTSGSMVVKVIAQSGGDKYNLSGRNYALAGVPSNVSATGSDMTGGTSKIIKTVSQSDIDGAKAKIEERLEKSVPAEMLEQLKGSQIFGLEDTLSAGSSKVSSIPAAGEEATDGAVVSVTTTYKMNGIKQADLEKMVKSEAESQIDTGKQSIRDTGMNEATVKITEKQAGGKVQIEAQSTVTAGPELNAEQVRGLIAGKKKGEAQSAINNLPGIKEVQINTSPFWVYSVPKKTTKISVEFQQANGQPTQ